MAHIKIELNNGVIEEVSTAIIDKLYLNTLNSDNTSNLKGRLHVGVSYRALVEYLTLKYPELYISVDNYAIPFEDPKMLLYLTETMGLGTDGMITEAQAALAIAVANSANTEVTKFNELRYFTNITESKNGMTGRVSGNIKFKNWTALEEVDISNFTSIGRSTSTHSAEDCFEGCTSLKTVVASNKLTYIGYPAFKNCSSLEEITGLYGVISVSDQAFNGCSSLKSETFNNCSVYLTNMPSNGSVTFKNCSSLTSITLDSLTTKIGQECFSNCTSLSSINFPESLGEIAANAFEKCSSLAISVNLSTNLWKLGIGAFNKSGILSFSTDAELSSTNLGTSIFLQCADLTTIHIKSIYGKIPNNIAYLCKELKSFTLDNYSLVTEIGSSCFANCNLSLSTSYNFPNVTSIGNNSFDSTKITSFSADLCTSIGNLAFNNCYQLSNISFNSVATISNSFFNCTSLTSISLPELTTITGSAFEGCTSLTSISLPKLTTISGGTPFSRCTALTFLDLPATLTTWPTNVATNGTAFITIIFRATTPPTLGSSGTGLSSALIYVPDEAVDDYKAAENWSAYADRIHPLSEYVAS